MRRLALALLLVCGCHRATAPMDAATPSAPSSTSAASVTTAAAPAAAIGLGLSTFAPPPAAAVTKNDRGVTLLSAGKPEEAATELEAAVALAPDFVLARYNLACAHARAGGFDAAEGDLSAVFDADFVGMRAHAAEDSDLAAFWKSPAGARLTARIPSYEARYHAVIDRGVRAILWRAGAGSRGHLKPSLVRVGVWDQSTRRFVAVAPPIHDAIFGFSASLVPYAVVATGRVRDMLGGDLDAGKNLDRVLVYPISTAGVPVATFKVDAEPQQATLSLGATGATLYVFSSIGVASPDRAAVLFDAPWGSPVVTKTVALDQAARMKLSRDRPVLIEIGYNHWGYVASESDGAYAYAPPALKLPSGATIEIPKQRAFYRGPARAVPSPSGDRVALTWDAAVLRCDPSRTIPGHYKMALVDTKTHDVSALGEGDGAGAVAFSKSGAMYVQRGTRAFEITEAGEAPLPEGVQLAPDLDRDDECGF